MSQLDERKNYFGTRSCDRANLMNSSLLLSFKDVEATLIFLLNRDKMEILHDGIRHAKYTVGHKDGFFSVSINKGLHNFMGYFLLWEIFRMSRVFTTTMLSQPVSS